MEGGAETEERKQAVDVCEIQSGSNGLSCGTYWHGSMYALVGCVALWRTASLRSSHAACSYSDRVCQHDLLSLE